MDAGVNFLPAEAHSASVDERLQNVVSVLAAHRIALWEYDFPTGRCSFENDFFGILGLDKAGIAFDDFDDFGRFVHFDDREYYRAMHDRIMDCDPQVSEMNLRVTGTRGETVWLENHFFFSGTTPHGRSGKLIAYTVNVTAQKEKEEEVRRLEERNRKVIGVLPEFIFIFDDRFHITDVMMSEDTILLHPREQLVGADARTIYAPEVSDLFIRNIRQCLLDGQLKEIEYYLDMDRRYYFQARIVPYEDNRVLALIHDTSDRVHRSLELLEAKHRAEESDRMKSVFLANMSHEIRTPLNAIVGFSEILASGESPEEREEYLEIIKSNSDLLLQLINDILDLSRLEAGKTETHLQPVETGTMLEEVEKVHRLKMKPGVELVCEGPQQEIWVATDRNRVTQVLFNFLSNAIKNTAAGTITLGAALHGDWLELYVSDTGRGIPKDKLSCIFERFEKLDDFAQGTGLGLSICRGIAERLGGRLEVRSAEGQGSTFSLYLPYREGGAGGKRPEETPESAGQGGTRGKRKTILVAEDVEANYKLIGAILRNEYTLLWARNGQEAVNSFLRERPDLVLMDIRMPVMNGLEATEKIRAVSTDIPIVAVTAHAYYTEQQQAMDAGCNAIISKPYSPEDLKKAIGCFL